MDLPVLQLLVLGAVIGANNLSAALTLGALGQKPRRARIVTVFGFFEFTVPLLGAAIGQALAVTLAGTGRWVSSALLLLVGAVTVLGGIRGGDRDERMARRMSSWRGLVLLAAGLSADNLAVGFSLGLGTIHPLLLATTIAVFSVAFTVVGLSLGNELRRHWERRAEIAAGALLLCLGAAAALGWL